MGDIYQHRMEIRKGVCCSLWPSYSQALPELIISLHPPHPRSLCCGLNGLTEERRLVQPWRGFAYFGWSTSVDMGRTVQKRIRISLRLTDLSTFISWQTSWRHDVRVAILYRATGRLYFPCWKAQQLRHTCWVCTKRAWSWERTRKIWRKWWVMSPEGNISLT